MGAIHLGLRIAVLILGPCFLHYRDPKRHFSLTVLRAWYLSVEDANAGQKVGLVFTSVLLGILYISLRICKDACIFTRDSYRNCRHLDVEQWSLTYRDKQPQYVLRDPLLQIYMGGTKLA
ncbi:hypothetical protein GOP47_0015795 [Adiantum capillus-veneris]|uniref:Uncharacterized protein n=1 Tax=Adiantum capillus-veneris TaxID=13818 RepID=A0A9D4UKZ0_ADICA|nr:hypothetical protein GOP47_0015795 [Adiantum capillus-veneris]